MKSQFFGAVSPLSEAFTVASLTAWLERYVNAIDPDNAVEYWSCGNSPLSLKGSADLPARDTVINVMVSVNRGSSEGFRLRANLMIRGADGQHTVRELCGAKVFGRAADAWRIAHAVSDALESIFDWGELPEVVAIADAVPRSHSWMRETSLAEGVIIAVTESRLRVATQSGSHVLDDRDFSQFGVNAKYAIEPRLADWKTVLTNMKATFVVQGA